MGKFADAKERVLDIIFPRRCPLCASVINLNERICSRCSKDVEFISRPVCRICGRPLYTCNCGREHYSFVRNVSPLIYTKAAKKGIHRMKFNNSPYSCVYFGKLMARTVIQEYIDTGVRLDCVIGVPMYKDDVYTRGYNQAVLLAKTVSDEIEVPLLRNVLIKDRKNKPQHTLSYQERRTNIMGVFSVSRPQAVRDKVVLLCDDVTTSGSTLNECAEVLLEAGAKAVYCVTATVAVMSEMPSIKSAAFGSYR